MNIACNFRPYQKPCHGFRSIRKIKNLGESRPYDCLVGISGGRDSSYLLYQLVNKHKLRCLAAYYRTPFTPNVISSNVQRIVKKLNTPLVEMKISREFHRKIARKMVMLWKNQPLPILANLACAPCKLLNREVFKICRQYDIKSIVFGGNPYEAFQFGPAGTISQRGHSFTPMLLRTLSNINKGIGLIVKHINLWRDIQIFFQSSIMYFNPHTCYLRIRYPDIYRIDYFHHYEWNESEMEKVLAYLEWKLPPGCNSTWRADCSFEELKNYMFYKSIGATHTDALFSNMVRMGILSRDEALRRIEVEGKISRERLLECYNILELPQDFLS